MKKVVAILSVSLLILLSVVTFTGCVDSNINVLVSKDNLGISISQDMYGLFIEDISYACDGGLVSNLIANTSFDYPASPLTNWNITGAEYNVESNDSMNANNPAYLAVSTSSYSTLTNKGYVEYYKYLTRQY